MISTEVQHVKHKGQYNKLPPQSLIVIHPLKIHSNQTWTFKL